MVYEACNSCGDVERKKIEESLSRIDAKLLTSGRDYDPNLSWLTNAENQHVLKSFRAIISNSNPRATPEVLISDDLVENTSLWKVSRELCVSRKASEICACVSRLLQASTEILFVDPHFRPNEKRYRNMLEKLIEVAMLGSRKPTRLEYHVNAELSQVYFQAECKSQIAPILPAGTEIVFVRWEQRDGGEALHPRYILTDIGGVRIEHGLDEGESGETTDISLLDYPLYLQRWSDYQRKTSSFQCMDELRIVGTH